MWKNTSHIYASACILSCFNHVRLYVTQWTVACQAPLSMRFSRKESWSGLPCPPPGHLPYPGINSSSLMSSALAGVFFTTSANWSDLACTHTHVCMCVYIYIYIHIYKTCILETNWKKKFVTIFKISNVKDW